MLFYLNEDNLVHFGGSCARAMTSKLEIENGITTVLESISTFLQILEEYFVGSLGVVLIVVTVSADLKIRNLQYFFNRNPIVACEQFSKVYLQAVKYILLKNMLGK